MESRRRRTGRVVWVDVKNAVVGRTRANLTKTHHVCVGTNTRRAR